ncbi:MAG: hypothetical protein AB7S74_08925 [Hyphomicrobium sp.]
MRSPKWQIGLAGLLMSATAMSAAFADEQAGLKQATDAIRRGNFSQAVQLLTTELEAQNRSVDERARTFYYRAKAYAGLKQPGRARADLNAAIWLGKLPASEAAEAGRLKTQLETSDDAAGEETVAVTPAPPKPPEPAKSEPLPKVTVAAPQPAPPTSFATTVAATPPPPPPRTEVSREKAAAPSWSQQSVSRAALPEPKPSPFIKTSPAFAAAAAQQRAEPPQASEVVTGSLPPARAVNPPSNPSPVAAHWETDVAANPSPPARSAPPVAAAQPTPPAAPMLAPQATKVTMAPAAPVMAPPPAAQATTQPAQSAQSAEAASSFGLSQDKSTPADTQDPSQASSVPLIGWMFEKSSSPYDKQIADADDFQRRYVEKIRRYNQERQAATSGVQQ